jgi:hypothetical protein
VFPVFGAPPRRDYRAFAQAVAHGVTIHEDAGIASRIRRPSRRRGV